MKQFIYELIDPITNETRYIGKSKNTIKRLEMHLQRDNLKGFTHKENWIKFLREKNLKPIINIIDEVETEEVNFWEIFYIALYKGWGCHLTNGTKGGDGGNTVSKLSIERQLEIREKRRLSLLGKNKYERTPELKARISATLTGRKRPEQSKKMIGRKASPETVKKLKDALEKRYLNGRSKKCKKVVQLSLTGEEIKIWDAISDIEKELNFGLSGIYECLRDETNTKTAYKFKWKLYKIKEE